MAYNLDIMIDDFNGAAFATAGEAEWGYISPNWFLTLPNGIANHAVGDLPADFVRNGGWADQVAKNDFTKRFMKANYHRIRGSCSSDTEAYFVAALRLHGVSRGLLVTQAARGVLENEVVFVDHLGGGWDAVENNIPVLATAAAINRWIKRFGTAVFHSVAYMFVTRGHHYKQEYLDKYNKLFDAQFMDRNPGFVLPNADIIYRQAVHAFGVKPLVDLTLSDKQANHMAAAMAIRWNPHAPVSGVAKITTSKAVLTEMTKERWWEAFRVRFQAEIGQIDAEVGRITANPYEYHVASRVVTTQPRRMVVQGTEAAFNRLSQFLLGYIDYLGRRHSLSGQVAITQKSGGAGPLADGFSRACSRYSKASPTDEQTTMTQYLSTM